MRVKVKPGKSVFAYNTAGGKLYTEDQEFDLVEHDGITVAQQFSTIAMVEVEVAKAPPKKAPVKKARKKTVKS